MEEELEINARKLGANEQYQIRPGIIRLWKKKKSDSEIAEIFNVSERHVRSVKKKYLNGGLSAIKPKKRGRKNGEKRILSSEQAKKIQQIIVDKTPDQLKFKECMWSRKNIAELIKERFGIEIKPSTLGYYLERWGFSVQRPVKRAYKQDQAKSLFRISAHTPFRQILPITASKLLEIHQVFLCRFSLFSAKLCSKIRARRDPEQALRSMSGLTRNFRA